MKSINNRFHDNIVTAFKEYYIEELKRKIRRTKDANAMECRFNGGTVPYGYRINAEHHYVVNRLTAPIVLEIYTRYVNGQLICDIQRELSKQNVSLSTARIRNILKNRNYIGEYHYDGIDIPDGIPMIIPADLFQLAQETMESRRTKRERAVSED